MIKLNISKLGLNVLYTLELARAPPRTTVRRPDENMHQLPRKGKVQVPMGLQLEVGANLDN